MAFDGKTEFLTCPGCNAVHKARWYRMPVKEHQTIRCKACGNIIFQGNSIKDFADVKLIAG